MLIKSLKKRCLIIATAAACVLTAGIAVSGIKSKTTVASANEGASTVDNIWNGGSSAASHFSEDNLNTLAQKAGYSSISAMVSAAEGGTVKDAAALGNWSVNLGGFVFNPMYLSKDTDGNAILTLWLASSSDTSTWSDGTYHGSNSKSFNGSTIYSNTYDGSYIHNYVLNGRSTYTTNWGSGTSQSANSTLMNKYAPLRASGGIGDYLVTPSKVSWQTSVPKSWKNDPSYNGTTKGTIANYPCNWMNDKLWLPSIYETYDKTNTNTTTVTLDNGLWNTSVAQRSNPTNSWLRSGYFSNYYSDYSLTSSGASNDYGVNTRYAVRPALHLNLTSAASHAAASSITPPTDLPATMYDGTSKKVEDMTTKPSWYNPAMVFTYKKAGAAVTSVTDAGVYSVDVTLTGGLLFDTSDGGSSTLRTISLTVDEKEVFIASGITASNKDYDGNTTATLNCAGAVITGKVGSDDLTVASATGVFATKTAGTGKTVNISGITLGGAKAANYTLAASGNQATTTADISPLTVTVASGITVSGGTKQYDGNTTAVADFSAVSITGKVSGDNLTVTATLSYSDKNVGTAKTVNITGLALDGSDKDNYVLAASGNQATCTADITAKSVSVSGVTANNKEYDGTTTATLNFASASLSGIISPDAASIDTSAGSGTFASKDVGLRSVNITGISLTGADAGNYTLTGGSVSVNAQITAKTVTVLSGITATNKEYDGGTAAILTTTGATIDGVVAGETVTCNGTGTFADKDVGTGKTVNISALTLGGADAGNYTLATSGNQATTTADITAKNLTVTITPGGGVYGGTITPASASLGAGYIPGEAPTLELTYTCASPVYNSTTVPTEAGNYTVTVTISTSPCNYALTGTTTANFVISASGNLVTVSITDWTYGDTPSTPVVTATYGGGTEVVTYYSDAACTTAIATPTATTAVGTYWVKAVVPATGSYSESFGTATFTIGQKEVTVSGIAASNKIYNGNTDVTLEYTGVTISGKVTGDDLTVTATGVFDNKNVGTGKTVTVSGLTLGGSDAANYTLAASGQQTECTADITAKEITVSGIAASNKAYDGTTDVTLDYSGITLSGIVSGDSVTATAAGAFDTAEKGTGKTVTISGLTLTGTDAANYTLAASGQQTECTADITGIEIVVSGITANNKDYDGNTDAVLDFSGVVLTGLLAGDDVSVTATGTFDNANAGFGRVVTITGLTLTGADAANYTLAVSGQQTECTADINGKVVTVSGISANSRQYDGTDTASFDCASAVIAGLTAGDDVTITVTGTFADSNVGSGQTVTITSITLGGADCGNYMLDFASSQQTATADITRRELTVDITADDHDANDGATPATVVLNNVLDGETVDYVLLYTGKTAKDETYSSADAPAAKGEYKATVTIDESVFTNYTLTGVTEKGFIITQTVGDDEGNKADIPLDGDFDFVVTQTPTNSTYNFTGKNVGYSARLWELNEDGTASREFRESMSCNITFKVPEMIATVLLNSGKPLNEVYADGDLLLYAVTETDQTAIETYKLFFDTKGDMFVKFAYSGEFPAEIVFNAPHVEEPASEKSAGIPWWVWLIVALAVAILIGIIVVIIVVAKKKKRGDDDTPDDGNGGNGGNGGKGGSNGIKNPPENASAQGEKESAEIKALKEELEKTKGERERLEKEKAKLADEYERKRFEAERQAMLDTVARREAELKNEIAQVRAQASQPQYVVQQPQPQYVIPPQPQYVMPPQPQPQYVVQQPSHPQTSQQAYDDAELKRILKKQSQAIAELREVVDGGFNDPISDEEANEIFNSRKNKR